MGYASVAIQGERGAFSEQAARQLLGNRVEVIPCRTLDDAFGALSTTDCAVVPVENSYAGIIGETYDNLVGRESLVVAAETYINVRHCLLARPGQTISGITRVYSHPQAFAQCDRYLRELGADCIPDYDTAGSAMSIARTDSPGCAAIASEQAAKLYGLAVLARDIQTVGDNSTRFWLVVPDRLGLEPVPGPSRTLVVVGLPDTPGALHSCLAPLARHNVNLARLQARPWRGRRWEYRFYLELEGRPCDPTLSRALYEISQSSDCRVLGSFGVADSHERSNVS